MQSKLKIATCQFPVSNDISKNAEYIRRFMHKAASNQSHLVHFSETALSGYAGVDFDSFDNFDWKTLEKETNEIISLAEKLNIWVVLGTSHFEKNSMPKNSVLIISDNGNIEARYDKKMLTKNDVKFYSAGNGSHAVITIKGVKWGVLICYDSCFQEMFNVYREQGTHVIFHSLYNARNKGTSFLDDITPAMTSVRALDNEVWIVASNSCAPYSNYPSCIAAPDGRIVQKLSRHTSGILYHEFPDDDYKKWKVRN